MSKKKKNTDAVKLLEADTGPTQVTTRAAQMQSLWQRINEAKTPAPADIEAAKHLIGK